MEEGRKLDAGVCQVAASQVPGSSLLFYPVSWMPGGFLPPGAGVGRSHCGSHLLVYSLLENKSEVENCTFGGNVVIFCWKNYTFW